MARAAESGNFSVAVIISREELSAAAKFKGLAPRLAELDYLQDMALISIYREFGNCLAFKGGTCLYKVYQLNRFSEDLDFTAGKGFKLKGFFERLPYFFNLLDIKSTVNVQRFENAMNVYLEVYGPLYDGGKETRATLIFNVSLRERILLPIERYSYKPIYKEIRPFDLFVMNEKEILAEKVRAIYARNKARDVYDLWYLLKRRGLSFDAGLVNKKLSYGRLKFEKSGFLAEVDEKEASWKKDLAALIAGELPSFARVKKEIGECI